MAKFNKGYSYLVSSDYGRWYIVHQTGLKSWRAMIFTHVIPEWHESVVIEGNATTLYEKLQDLCNDRAFVARAYSANDRLRHAMFDILKTGKIGG